MKKLTFTTSSRNKEIRTLSSETLFRKNPYGSFAVLYHLEKIGWKVDRLGFAETINPAICGRFLKDLDPDLIYSYGITALGPILARKKIKTRSIPVVHCWEDYYSEIWKAKSGILAGLMIGIIESLIVKKSDYIITISRYAQARAAKWGKTSWYVPVACDPPEYDPELCKIKLSGKFKIVHLGSMDKYRKGPEIVKAMKQLPNKIRLYFVGKPDPEVESMAKTTENVEFLGFLSENEKWSVLEQADAVICGSDQDCAGKFYQYLRAEKPIVAYDGRPNLLFAHRQNALLSKDFASSIMEMHNSPNLCEELVRNAKNEVETLSERAKAERINRILRTIIDDFQKKH